MIVIASIFEQNMFFDSLKDSRTIVMPGDLQATTPASSEEEENPVRKSTADSSSTYLKIRIFLEPIRSSCAKNT
jgi:hypothetical protein